MKLGSLVKRSSERQWLTPRYEEYVVGNRSVPEERDALVEIMTRAPRVRTSSFSASDAGTCMRRRQFKYAKSTGVGEPIKVDARSGNIFMTGDYVHLRHQVAGIVGKYLKKAEDFHENERYLLRGTIDAVTVEDRIGEYKSINSNGFRGVVGYGPKKEHVEQVHSYFVLTGLKEAHILYENKDTQELKEFWIEEDKEITDKVLGELTTLVEKTREKKLLPMLHTCVAKTGFAYRYCPYREVCPLVTEETIVWD